MPMPLDPASVASRRRVVMTVLSWLRERRVRLGLWSLGGIVTSLAAVDAADASTNLLVNPSLESMGPYGVPACWAQTGWGDNRGHFSMVHPGHSGTNAVALTISAHTTGDRKMMVSQTPYCAPDVLPGHQYDLSLWYT